MINLRKAQDRGRTLTPWLDSAHTFSFASYYDPNFLGFGNLQVINDDVIQAQSGFGMHGHQDMEIITYVIDGVLEHKDSMGNGSQILPGEIQRMSAGRGVQHSEYNPSPFQSLHLLQIWIRPQTLHLNPSYEQKRIPNIKNDWILIGAEEEGEHSVKIHQDVKLYGAYLQKKHTLKYPLHAKRKLWVQLIKGQIQLNHYLMEEGDGVAIEKEEGIEIICGEKAELLLFDLKS